MFGKSNLLAFSFRALVLLLLVPLLWLTVARQYNEALVVLAQRLLPDGPALSALGTHIMIDYSEAARPFSVDGFTLHYGLILMTVLILASVGLDLLPRIGWLLAFGVGGFVLHVVGVALLARGVAWASAEGFGRGLRLPGIAPVRHLLGPCPRPGGWRLGVPLLAAGCPGCRYSPRPRPPTRHSRPSQQPRAY